MRLLPFLLPALYACGACVGTVRIDDTPKASAETAAADTSGETGQEETAADSDTHQETAADTSGETGQETAADSDTHQETAADTDTAPPCAGVTSADPAAVNLTQSGPAVSVTISGCADPLAVACDSWIVASSPAGLDGEAVISVSTIHGIAAPADGACELSGGFTLPVHLAPG